MFDSLPPSGLQHARLPCPSPAPRAYSNSCPLSQWCHPTISSSVIPFSSCLQCFPASGSFPISQFFTSVGQSVGVSASASVQVRIFKARVLEWVTISFSRGSSQPGDRTQVSHIAGRHLTIWATREAPQIWLKWTYLWNRNEITDIGNGLVVAKGEWVWGGWSEKLGWAG